VRAGRALALAAALREPVVTTDPLAVKMLLRDGGNSLLLRWKLEVERDSVGGLVALFVGLVRCEGSLNGCTDRTASRPFRPPLLATSSYLIRSDQTYFTQFLPYSSSYGTQPLLASAYSITRILQRQNV
jgi:hypothetical protein